VVDDAYHGLLYDDGLFERSLYWDIAERADPERTFVVRLDGATKELLLFPSRVGFLTHNAPDAAAPALLSKLLCVSRGTVGAPPGPSQAVIYDVLKEPDLEDQIADRVALLRRRCLVLRDALDHARTTRLSAYPFNSGCFALVHVDDAIPVEPLRKRLIAEFDVGLVAFASVNALRIAYCSMDVDTLPEVVGRLARAVETA